MAIPDADTLRRHYEDEGMTVQAIARRYRCRDATMRAALDQAGIRRRPGRRRAPLPAWASDPETRTLLQTMIAVHGAALARAFVRDRGINAEKFYLVLGKPPVARGSRRRVDDGAVRAAYDAGARISDLAAQYGCARRTITRSLDRTTPGVCPSESTDARHDGTGCDAGLPSGTTAAHPVPCRRCCVKEPDDVA